MSKQKKKHTCPENWYKDAEIRYEKINSGEWGWVLDQWQIATKHDIEDGYPGEIGSSMCSHTLLISHCPFCGKNLTKIEANTW